MTQRRKLLQTSLTGAAAALTAFGSNPALAQEMGKLAGRSDKPLKAAFSNAGLQATWCAQGKQAAEFWGRLFNVEVTWFDGELAAQKQRAAVDNMASQKWDFVAIQAFRYRHIDRAREQANRRWYPSDRYGYANRASRLNQCP
jgi:ribose transport system substrate-binding protein